MEISNEYDSHDSIKAIYEKAQSADRHGFKVAAASLYREIANRVDCSKKSAFLLLAASSSIDCNDFDAAKLDCENAIAIRPDSYKAWRWLGLTHLRMHFVADAERALLQSITLQPSATAFNYLGVVYLETDRFLEAETSFRRAVELDSGFEEAHANLGRVLCLTFRETEAIHEFRTALTIAPGLECAYLQLARLLLKRQEVAVATRVLEEGIGANPVDVDGRALLASIVHGRS